MAVSIIPSLFFFGSLGQCFQLYGVKFLSSILQVCTNEVYKSALLSAITSDVVFDSRCQISEKVLTIFRLDVVFLFMHTKQGWDDQIK